MIVDRTRRLKRFICLVVFSVLGVLGGYDVAVRATSGVFSHSAERLAAAERFAEDFWPCTLGGAIVGLACGFLAGHVLQRARPWEFVVVLIVTWLILAIGSLYTAATHAVVLFVLALVWFIVASGEESPE